jgi:hypothetical protein
MAGWTKYPMDRSYPFSQNHWSIAMTRPLLTLPSLGQRALHNQLSNTRSLPMWNPHGPQDAEYENTGQPTLISLVESSDWPLLSAYCLGNT